MLAELGDLGCDDELAVALVRVAREVFLVIVLSRVERVNGRNFGHNRVIPELGSGDVGDFVLGDSFLLRRVIEDGRAVLCAHVIALAIERRRVMDGEEHVEQIGKAHDLWIERDLDDLRVAGRAIADGLVSGIGNMPTGIAGDHIRDTLELIVDGFQTPETAPGEGGDFQMI